MVVFQAIIQTLFIFMGIGSVMLFVAFLVEPKAVLKFFRWNFTSSELNPTFMDELKSNSMSVRERQIQKAVNKWSKRIPRIMRLEAAGGALYCNIRAEYDYDIQEEVVKRLFEWATKNGLKPSAMDRYGFRVNWN